MNIHTCGIEYVDNECPYDSLIGEREKSFSYI